MKRNFSGQLDIYLRQTGLPLRRLARRSGIPHQTLFNWVRGAQPRLYPTLPEDLQRLGAALGLSPGEFTLLQRLAGCAEARTGLFDPQEVPMEYPYRIPKGWFVTGEATETYAVGLDPAVTYQGRPCVTIQAGPQPSEFAGLAQMFKAGVYQGKRLRFSAVLRTAEVENRAALFMRVSAADGRLLAFDNMRNRPLTGSSDWAQQVIVLDVDEQAEDILFGLLLSLGGQVWMADVHLEEVGKEVPTTDLLEEIAPYFPVNLGFEE